MIEVDRGAQTKEKGIKMRPIIAGALSIATLSTLGCKARTAETVTSVTTERKGGYPA
jgi:hypothetical protein